MENNAINKSELALLPDHLGSSNIITDSSGSFAQGIFYTPYGDIRINVGSIDVRHKYTGQEYDAETGLYYYGARYYDPLIARFISADTIVPAPMNPQSLNRYSYVLNNPLIYTDPTGHFSLKKFFKSVISGIAGGIAFVLSGGNPVIAGMVAGAVSGAMTGRIENVFVGAITGGILGGVGGAIYQAFGATGAYAMLGAGAGAAIAQNGLDGLAYYAGGIAGGIAGAVWASNFTSPVGAAGQSIEDDPLHFNGKRLTATDASGKEVGSWPGKSGVPGSTPEDQMKFGFGPIPEGKYIVDPGQIQRWGDLPWYQKTAAYLGRGEWPGGTPSWGHTRVPIQIPAGINIVPRTGGFFIHGGQYIGSAGCIDLAGNAPSFFNYFSGQSGAMPLTVNYGR